MKKKLALLFTCMTLLLAAWTAAPVQAADPVVRAVLFYSPSCGHCHKVMTEDLPVIMETFKEQFELLAIDVSSQGGSALYQAMTEHFDLPQDRLGVPALVIGNVVLVGSLEIPQQLPWLIEQALTQGGLDWPAVPELLLAIEQYEQSLAQKEPPEAVDQVTPMPVSGPVQNADGAGATAFAFSLEGMQAAFLNDPVANTIAVVVLVVMLVSLVAVGLRYLNGPDQPAAWLTARWIIPVLALLGLGVAAYLSYSEVFGGAVVCGPVGQCESVQDSPYAKLFGMLHVGVLGMIGYIAILLAWVVARFGPTGTRTPAIIVIWGMAWFGVLFSIYLTFLEPFVIGATCMWCITSALIMTALLWSSNEEARLLLNEEDEEDFEEDMVQA
jgi:uncharacterized membrane protein